MSNRPDQPEPLKSRNANAENGSAPRSGGETSNVRKVAAAALSDGVRENDLLAFVESDADEGEIARVHAAATRNAELSKLMGDMRTDRERLQSLGPTSTTTSGYDGAGLAAGLLGTARTEKSNAKRAGRPSEPLALEPVEAGTVTLMAQFSSTRDSEAEEDRAVDLEFGAAAGQYRMDRSSNRSTSRRGLYWGLAAAVAAAAGLGLVAWGVAPALTGLSERIASNTPETVNPAAIASTENAIGQDMAGATDSIERSQPDASAPIENSDSQLLPGELANSEDFGREQEITEERARSDGVASAVPVESTPRPSNEQPALASLTDAEAARAARDGRLLILVTTEARGRRAARTLATESVMGGTSYQIAGPLPESYETGLDRAMNGTALEPGLEPDMNASEEGDESRDAYAATVRATPQSIRELGAALERQTRGTVRFVRASSDLIDSTPSGQMNLWTPPTRSPGGRITAGVLVSQVS